MRGSILGDELLRESIVPNRRAPVLGTIRELPVARQISEIDQAVVTGDTNSPGNSFVLRRNLVGGRHCIYERSAVKREVVSRRFTAEIRAVDDPFQLLQPEVRDQALDVGAVEPDHELEEVGEGILELAQLYRTLSSVFPLELKAVIRS